AAVREQVVGLVGRDLPRLPGRTVHAREGRPGGRDARERRVDGAGARHTGGDRRPGTDTAYPADGDGTGGRGGEGLLSTVGASLHDLVRVPTVEDLVELTLQDHVAQGGGPEDREPAALLVAEREHLPERAVGETVGGTCDDHVADPVAGCLRGGEDRRALLRHPGRGLGGED